MSFVSLFKAESATGSSTVGDRAKEKPPVLRPDTLAHWVFSFNLFILQVPSRVPEEGRLARSSMPEPPSLPFQPSGGLHDV